MLLLKNTPSRRNISETTKTTLLSTMMLTRRVERKVQRAEEKQHCRERHVCNHQSAPLVWRTRVFCSMPAVVLPLIFFVSSLSVRKRSVHDIKAHTSCAHFMPDGPRVARCWCGADSTCDIRSAHLRTGTDESPPRHVPWAPVWLRWRLVTWGFHVSK